MELSEIFSLFNLGVVVGALTTFVPWAFGWLVGFIQKLFSKV